MSQAVADLVDLRRFRSYPAYKDSGVEWIGNVPSHWSSHKMGYLTQMVSGGTPSKDNPAYWRGSIPWVSPKDMKRRDIADSIDHVSDLAVANTGLVRLMPPVALIVVRGMILAHTFPVAITSRPVTINQDMKGLRLNRAVDGNYFVYLLEGMSRFVLSLVEEAGHGTKRLGTDLWRAIGLFLPSFDEQRAIAAFLDRETSKIDALVAKKERLIELLQEKRTALVTHAVTKGLDPNAPMKPSGIEWLGDIPVRWDAVRTRFLCDLTTGDKDTQDAKDEGDYPFFVRSQTIERLPTYTFEGEGVLTSGDGAGVGKIFHHYIGKFDFHQRVYLFFNFRRVLGRFFYYFLKANLYKVVLAMSAKSTVDSLRRPMLQNFPIAVGPLQEQQAIVDLLDVETKKIDQLVDVVTSQIRLFGEYRTALISAAVTGKIDVREEVE